MHFTNLDALGSPWLAYFIYQKDTICFSLLMSACSKKSFCPSCKHKKFMYLQGTYISKLYPQAGALQKGSLNPSSQEKLSLEVTLPKAGMWTGCSGKGGVSFGWDKC